MTNELQEIQTPWFLTDYVLAAIDGPEKAAQATQALRDSGFHAEDIQNMSSEEASERMDVTCEHCGVLKHVARIMWSYISIQGSALREFQQKVDEGSHIVAIHVNDRDEVKQAAKILFEHRARDVQHFGSLGEVVESTP